MAYCYPALHYPSLGYHALPACATRPSCLLLAMAGVFFLVLCVFAYTAVACLPTGTLIKSGVYVYVVAHVGNCSLMCICLHASLLNDGVFLLTINPSLSLSSVSFSFSRHV